MPDQFQLPLNFEMTAVFLFAITGGLVAIEKRYDVVGVFVLALLSAVGGGLVRDGLFLQRGAPLVLQDERYLYVISAATVLCLIAGTLLNRFRVIFLLADALGLGTYAVVGTEHALAAGLPVVPAAFVGLANAVGGGMVRDLLTGQQALLLQPGEFYVLAAAVGTHVFLGLRLWVGMPSTEAALWAIGTTFVIRIAAITFNWRTRAVQPLLGRQ